MQNNQVQTSAPTSPGKKVLAGCLITLMIGAIAFVALWVEGYQFGNHAAFPWALLIDLLFVFILIGTIWLFYSLAAIARREQTSWQHQPTVWNALALFLYCIVIFLYYQSYTEIFPKNDAVAAAIILIGCIAPLFMIRTAILLSRQNKKLRDRHQHPE